jgi:hypothetical protein
VENISLQTAATTSKETRMPTPALDGETTQDGRICRVAWMTSGGSLGISDRMEAVPALRKLEELLIGGAVFAHVVQIAEERKSLTAEERWEMVS